EYARSVSGARAEDAKAIENAALVGRARAKLNLGDGAGAVADAEQVEEGFVGLLFYEAGGSRRREWNGGINLDDEFSVRPHYRNLQVDGVPDPRVPVRYVGPSPFVGVEHWVQEKYPHPGSDIPFATWREAQLIIAEAEGGQRA